VVEQVPKPFLRVLADLTDWLQEAGVPSMVIGGVAVAILGRPRATRDVDTLALMSDDTSASVLSAAKRHGIEARVENPLDFARRTHVLLLRHIEAGIDIDVLLGRLPYQEEAVGRGRFHDLGGVRVRLPEVEDLLIMKAVAQRPQDLRDIEGLLGATESRAEACFEAQDSAWTQIETWHRGQFKAQVQTLAGSGASVS
jgi:hypothetical protein